MTEVHKIESDTGNGTYTVQISDTGEVHCNCKSFEFAPFPKTCKHIKRIQNDRS